MFFIRIFFNFDSWLFYQVFGSRMKSLNRFFAVIAAVLVIAGLSSCTMNLPISATENPIGSKVGEADGVEIFPMGIMGYYGYGLSFYGDASIMNACKKAGITKVSTVDFHSTNYLGIVAVHTCVVTGE